MDAKPARTPSSGQYRRVGGIGEALVMPSIPIRRSTKTLSCLILREVARTSFAPLVAAPKCLAAAQRRRRVAQLPPRPASSLSSPALPSMAPFALGLKST